jgi:hypothetical protein
VRAIRAVACTPTPTCTVSCSPRLNTRCVPDRRTKRPQADPRSLPSAVASVLTHALGEVADPVLVREPRDAFASGGVLLPAGAEFVRAELPRVVEVGSPGVGDPN